MSLLSFYRVAICCAMPAVLSQLCATPAMAGPDAPPRAGFFDSTWPYGRSDTWRTGAVRGAGLPDGIESRYLMTQSVELPKTPYWGVTYTNDTMFVLGGQPFILEPFSFATSDDVGLITPMLILTEALKAAVVRPYVAKIDQSSMSVIELLEFPRNVSPKTLLKKAFRAMLPELDCGNPFVSDADSGQGEDCSPQPGISPNNVKPLNYPGTILIHENGSIYVVATAQLYEIDPVTMAITRILDLPNYETRPLGTVYNGMTLAPLTGDIILKGFNFFDPSQPAILLAVDPARLRVRFSSELPGVGATRLTTAAHDGAQFIYATDSTQTKRVVIGSRGFEVDEAWSETYRAQGEGTTPAVSLTYMGEQNYVAFQNNNTVIAGVTEPLALFSQETDTTAPTLESLNANRSMLPGGSWPSLTADPFTTGVFVSPDGINGRLAAWRRERGTLFRQWETKRYQSTAGAAIASDQGHLYIDDRRCDGSGKNCKLFLVILDLTTGKRIAKVRVAGSSPSFGQIFLGADSAFFVAMEADKRIGFVTKVSAGIPTRKHDAGRPRR